MNFRVLLQLMLDTNLALLQRDLQKGVLRDLYIIFIHSVRRGKGVYMSTFIEDKKISSIFERR